MKKLVRKKKKKQTNKQTKVVLTNRMSPINEGANVGVVTQGDKLLHRENEAWAAVNVRE